MRHKFVLETLPSGVGILYFVYGTNIYAVKRFSKEDLDLPKEEVSALLLETAERYVERLGL